MIYDNHPTHYSQEIALARKLIAHGEKKQRIKRRARFVRVVRAIGKAVVVAGFLVLFILAMFLEQVP